MESQILYARDASGNRLICVLSRQIHVVFEEEGAGLQMKRIFIKKHVNEYLLFTVSNWGIREF